MHRSCHMCGKQFKRKQNADIHLMGVHGLTKDDLATLGRQTQCSNQSSRHSHIQSIGWWHIPIQSMLCNLSRSSPYIINPKDLYHYYIIYYLIDFLICILLNKKVCFLCNLKFNRNKYVSIILRDVTEANHTSTCDFSCLFLCYQKDNFFTIGMGTCKKRKVAIFSLEGMPSCEQFNITSNVLSFCFSNHRI